MLHSCGNTSGITREGTRVFLVLYNVDNGPGSTTNLNFWNGSQFDTNITTSVDAGWSYFNVEFNPKFQINPAIRITGRYRLGTYGVPLNSNYHTQDARGVNTAFSDGQWTMFWITAQTPLGRVRYRQETMEIWDRSSI